MKIKFDKCYNVDIYRTISYPIYYPNSALKNLENIVTLDEVKFSFPNITMRDNNNTLIGVFEGYLSLPITTINNVIKGHVTCNNYAKLYKLHNGWAGGSLIIFPNNSVDYIIYGSGVPIIRWMKGKIEQ